MVIYFLSVSAAAKAGALVAGSTAEACFAAPQESSICPWVKGCPVSPHHWLDNPRQLTFDFSKMDRSSEKVKVSRISSGNMWILPPNEIYHYQVETY